MVPVGVCLKQSTLAALCLAISIAGSALRADVILNGEDISVSWDQVFDGGGMMSPAVTSLPTTFDLRNVGGVNYVTPVKNQGSYNTCWTFATMATVEADLLKAGGPALDLSENNLANNHGFAWTVSQGGLWQMSIAYMAMLKGPGLESADPYPNFVAGFPTSIPRQRTLTNSGYYTTQTNIKNALMTKGALFTDMYWTGSSYNSATNSYYCTTGRSYNYNHSVALVGWDDNKVTAGGTGAWLVKNSWGTSWGDGGYFWLSYQGTDAQYAMNFETREASLDQRVYSYSPHGWSYASNWAYSTTVYHATMPEKLTSVGFFALAGLTYTGSIGYTLSVYSHATNGTPSGLLSTQAGFFSNWGFHVVDLPQDLTLTPGQEFVIYLAITSGSAYTAIDANNSNWITGKTALPGQSYISADGVNWTDTTSIGGSWNYGASVAMYAYTEVIPEPATASLLLVGVLVMFRRRR